MAKPLSQWTREELLAVRHIGPSKLGETLEEGRAIFEAAQRLTDESNEGVLGPAKLSTEPVVPLSLQKQAKAEKPKKAGKTKAAA